MASKDEMKERLGKGVGAYFSGMVDDQSSVINNESSVITKDLLENNNKGSLLSGNSSKNSDDIEGIRIDRDALAIAITEAKNNPRVPLWSEMAKTLLLYNQIIRDKRTIRPKVSLSEEGSKILDEAMREAFPDMCKLIEKKLKSD
jgi:hypothetical protein